jgi:glutamine phosphoribosylpyrophosphate amidotransferase
LRGVHSFGYSFYSGETIITRKFVDFGEFHDSIQREAPEKFIAHFRYSTSGDYKNPDNNQPLQSKNTALAFNGVISQKSKNEIEAEYGIKMPSDNDGHVLLQKYKDKSFRASQKVTYAAIGLADGKLFALRNSKRPLWQSVGSKASLFASTKDVFVRSGVKNCDLIQSGVIHEF